MSRLTPVPEYITKLPVTEFLREGDIHFQTRQEYDLEEFHEADRIRVRLPTTEPEDYSPPIYDSDDELRPKERKHHWATCDNDSCEVYEDQKIVNNYQPKQARFKIPKPSNDQPEVIPLTTHSHNPRRGVSFRFQPDIPLFQASPPPSASVSLFRRIKSTRNGVVHLLGARNGAGHHPVATEHTSRPDHPSLPQPPKRRHDHPARLQAPFRPYAPQEGEETLPARSPRAAQRRNPGGDQFDPQFPATVCNTANDSANSQAAAAAAVIAPPDEPEDDDWNMTDESRAA